MPDKCSWVFFYGLYMDFEILHEHGLIVQQWEVAKLDGYVFRIGSWGYLEQSDSNCVYGVSVFAKQKEIAKLYSPETSTLPVDYFPEPVLVAGRDGRLRNALCYVATSEPKGAVNVNYINGMVKLAQHFGFPDWYVERLEGFRPGRERTTHQHIAIQS